MLRCSVSRNSKPLPITRAQYGLAYCVLTYHLVSYINIHFSMTVIDEAD